MPSRTVRDAPDEWAEALEKAIGVAISWCDRKTACDGVPQTDDLHEAEEVVDPPYGGSSREERLQESAQAWADIAVVDGKFVAHWREFLKECGRNGIRLDAHNQALLDIEVAWPHLPGDESDEVKLLRYLLDTRNISVRDAKRMSLDELAEILVAARKQSQETRCPLAADHHHREKSRSTTGNPARRHNKPTESAVRTKLISALTKHHQYAEGGCLHLSHIGNNELATAADVSKSTASTFFKDEFDGFAKYKVLCRDAVKLALALKLLNNEVAPHFLLGDRSSDLAAPQEEDTDTE